MRDPDKARARYRANPEEYKARSRAQRLADPEGTKAYQAAYYAEHAERVKAQSRKWEIDHPERVRARQKAWRLRNPERVKARGRPGKIARRAWVQESLAHGPKPSIDVLAEIIRSPCVYCGDKATVFDHVRARAQGGWHVEANIVAACWPCNRDKWSRLLTEWDPIRTAHGAASNWKVAAEVDRLIHHRP